MGPNSLTFITAILSPGLGFVVASLMRVQRRSKLIKWYKVVVKVGGKCEVWFICKYL